MACEIVYSHRVACTRFGSCETHGWCGRWRWFGRERRDALRHVETWAALERVPLTWTEQDTPGRLPINWRAALIGAPIGSLAVVAGWLVTR